MNIESCVIYEKKPLLSVNEAQERIYAELIPLTQSELIPLKQAFGRILAHTVYAPNHLPFARNSAMDGYAFCSHEVSNSAPFTLNQIGVVFAGRPFNGQLNKGECVRIFTGGVVPDHADSVIMQEQVIAKDATIHFPSGIEFGNNIRQIGEDVRAGDPLCLAHKTLSAIDLGFLASAGIENVNVIRKLNIAYFSTGDELIGLGEQLTTGKIYDSNRYSLHGLLQNPSYAVFDGGVIADNRDLLKQTLLQAAEKFDVVITTGGASVGDADYIKDVLAECGEVNFWKIAMKPGKPLAFGKIGHCYFFGLPGNPVAVTTTFDIILKPALRYLTSTYSKKPFLFSACCKTPLTKSRGRQEFQRGILTQTLDGVLEVATSGHQGSHVLSSASTANCYIILDEEVTQVASGDWVNVLLF